MWLPTPTTLISWKHSLVTSAPGNTFPLVMKSQSFCSRCDLTCLINYQTNAFWKGNNVPKIGHHPLACVGPLHFHFEFIWDFSYSDFWDSFLPCSSAAMRHREAASWRSRTGRQVLGLHPTTFSWGPGIPQLPHLARTPQMDKNKRIEHPYNKHRINVYIKRHLTHHNFRWLDPAQIYKYEQPRHYASLQKPEALLQ